MNPLIKDGPPLVVSGFYLLGFPLQEWLVLLTVIYTLILIFGSLRKYLTGRRHCDYFETCKRRKV